uniref:Death domain-containing protein n=1 Tax=Myripristis murdjan TaxID=586833 RepID=A0A667XYM5_9TELE
VNLKTFLYCSSCLTVVLLLFRRVTSSAPPQTKAKDTPVPLYQALLTRVRRQGCQDGEYQHEGKTCCFCPAGNLGVLPSQINLICLKHHQGLTPTLMPVCCSSVILANLEEKEPCTVYRNRVCQCKDGFYCTTPGCVTCRLCVDLFPFLPEIANLMEWTVMRDVAVRSGMPLTAIDVHEENHPRDRREQIFHLLREWVEREGKEASKQLVKTLQDMGKRNTAEAVVAIINSNGNAGGNV